MSQLIPTSETLKPARPTWVLFAVGLVLLAGLAGFFGYKAWQSGNVLKQNFKDMELAWESRVRDSSLPNYEDNKRIFDEDKRYLDSIERQTNTLGVLFFISLGFFSLLSLGWMIFTRATTTGPMRKLEASVHNVVNNGLKGHIWGRDRDDLTGSLARSIDAIRDNIVNMADMTVQGPDGTRRFHFDGKGGEAFNSLINDLHGSLARLIEKGDKLEAMNAEKATSLQRLGEHIRTQSAGLGAMVDETKTSLEGTIAETREHLNRLQSEWMTRYEEMGTRHAEMQGQAQGLIGKFEQDMQSLRQIAGLTGQRVSQMLQNLGTTDHDYKKAAKLSLEVSETFSRQAADLSEKLSAATSLMRASGKIMSETTESSRARLAEAVASVEQHDETLRAFLSDTAEKTERVSGLFDEMKVNAARMAEAVAGVDTRLSNFEERSHVAFERIAANSEAVEKVSSQLEATNTLLIGSSDNLRGQSDALGDIVYKVRGEYSEFIEAWRKAFAETSPAIDELKGASQKLSMQLTEEWSLYTTQSRTLLSALERDVQHMNGRTQQVTSDTEKLILHLATQSQRLGDGANHFDLQVATLSQRLEDAAAHVLRSNEQVVQQTAGQVQEVHGSVQDLVQRLAILSQLTGTLGTVAGQLGQIVPGLTDRANNSVPNINGTLGTEIIARVSDMTLKFNGQLDTVRGEFSDVRAQISKWVEALTSGYQRMSADITGLDAKITERITELLKQMPAPQVQTIAAPGATPNTDMLLPALKLIQENLSSNGSASQQIISDLQNLHTNVQAVGQYVQQTTQILHNMNSIFAEGFTRIENKESAGAAPAGFDPARMEQASIALEKMIRAMQAQSFSLAEKLEQVTQSLAETTSQLQSKLKSDDQKTG